MPGGMLSIGDIFKTGMNRKSKIGGHKSGVFRSLYRSKLLLFGKQHIAKKI